MIGSTYEPNLPAHHGMGNQRAHRIPVAGISFYERPLRVVSESMIWENTSSGVLDSSDFLVKDWFPMIFIELWEFVFYGSVACYASLNYAILC